MGSYNRKDHYYKKAKEEGLASRASYKLEQLQIKYKLVKPGNKIVDLGCAPGGWLQMFSKYTGPKGQVVGIDLLEVKIQPKPNITIFKGDITDPIELKKIEETLQGKADVVVSDMSPNLSGIRFKDVFASYELCLTALDSAHKLLKPGGNFLAKIFEGNEVKDFKTELQKYFEKVAIYVPKATRKESSENYIVGLNYTV
ncbi:RlmE family RNA methyltransferase [bacterium]|nr:RlmE family RNA methyltransferase [bacterium]